MNTDFHEQWAGLPGAELIGRGIEDLESGVLSESALLVLIAEPRLARLGIRVKARPIISGSYEHTLYELLEKEFGAGAHARFNSLIRRVVSFEHALERERRVEVTKTTDEPRCGEATTKIQRDLFEGREAHETHEIREKED